MAERFEQQRAAHPEWEGLTVGIVSDGGDGNLSAYTSGDPRMRFFADLGFDTTALDDLATAMDQGFWVTFSPENIEQLADLDVGSYESVHASASAMSLSTSAGVGSSRSRMRRIIGRTEVAGSDGHD